MRYVIGWDPKSARVESTVETSNPHPFEVHKDIDAVGNTLWRVEAEGVPIFWVHEDLALELITALMLGPVE